MNIYNFFYEKSIYLVWKIRLSAINNNMLFRFYSMDNYQFLKYCVFLEIRYVYVCVKTTIIFI
jgi:hypothetical protein